MQTNVTQPRSCYVTMCSRNCGSMKWHSSRQDPQDLPGPSRDLTWPRICPSTRGETPTMPQILVVAQPRSPPTTRITALSTRTWTILHPVRQIISLRTHSTEENSQVDHFSKAIRKSTRRKYCQWRKSFQSLNLWSMANRGIITTVCPARTRISM